MKMFNLENEIRYWLQNITYRIDLTIMIERNTQKMLIHAG